MILVYKSKMIPLFRVKMSDGVPEAVSRTLTSGFVTQGPRVDEFEEKLCSKFDHPYILTLNSATAGLTLAVRLLEAPSANWPGFDASTDVVLSTPLHVPRPTLRFWPTATISSGSIQIPRRVIWT